MNLSVSNVAWNQDNEPAVFAALRARGVLGIEIAPTKIWPDWQGITAKSASRYRRTLEDEGFQVPALQAIVYGRPELWLFGRGEVRVAVLDHFRRVADLATLLGARVIVYGAPKNRDRAGLDPDEAFAWAVDLFRDAGGYCAERGVSLCIEPNPPAYGCNFITRCEEGTRLVRAVDSPGFALHLDAAGMHLAGDDGACAIPSSLDVLRHFHISEPHLADFRAPQIDHAALAAALRDGAYDGWMSIEMRASPDHPVDRVVEAVDYAIAQYGP